MYTPEQVVLSVVVLMAAFTDLRAERIPNWLSFPGALLGIVLHTLSGGAEGALFGAYGWLAGFGLTIGFYAVGGMGAGDVKLVALVGAFLGAQRVLWVAMYTAVLGGIYALGIVIYSLVGQGLRGRAAGRFPGAETGLELLQGNVASKVATLRKYPRLRYAVVVALGVVVEAWYGAPRF